MGKTTKTKTNTAKTAKKRVKTTVRESIGKKKDYLVGVRSAWVLFCMKNRTRIVKDNPTLSFGDICKALSREWKSLSEEQRSVFKQMQQQDLQRHLEQKSKLTKGDKRCLRIIRQRKQRKRRESGAPRPPLSSYMRFFVKNRPQYCKDNPTLDFRDIGKKLGEHWKQMTAAQKEEYTSAYETEYAEYENEKRKYLEAKQKARNQDPQPQ